LIELRQIGLNISEGQIQEEKRVRKRRGVRRALATKQEQQMEAEQDFGFGDEHLSFIAGYTSAGALYGVTWQEEEELSHRFP
jgi:hypothetical protein